jgi:hypothetical protein
MRSLSFTRSSEAPHLGDPPVARAASTGSSPRGRAPHPGVIIASRMRSVRDLSGRPVARDGRVRRSTRRPSARARERSRPPRVGAEAFDADGAARRPLAPAPRRQPTTGRPAHAGRRGARRYIRPLTKLSFRRSGGAERGSAFRMITCPQRLGDGGRAGREGEHDPRSSLARSARRLPGDAGKRPAFDGDGAWPSNRDLRARGQGHNTRRIGRRESEASPVITVRNGRPATRPARSRIDVPELPASSGSADPRRPLQPPPSTSRAPSPDAVTCTPRLRRHAAVDATSAPGARPAMDVRPRAIAPSIRYRCEIDLSPGTVSVPASERAGVMVRVSRATGAAGPHP